MEKRFIYFSTKAKFLSAKQGTEYDFTSILFIGDSKEIWNRGIFYGTPNDFDINDYLTKSDAASTYQPKGNYLTEHQDLSEYAKTSELEEAIKDFATESYVDEAVAAVDVTEQLVNYATKEYVGQEIAKIEIPSIDGLATEEYVDGAIEDLNIGDYAKKSELPTDFYSKQEVDSKVAGVKSEILGGAGEDYDTLKEIEEWVEEHQDLYSALVSTVGEKTTMEAVQKWVKEQNYLNAVPDTYATKEYVDGKVAEIEVPSVEGLASEEYVDEAIEGLSEVYQPKGNYLTEHQSLADYAKSADVTKEIAEAVEGLSETYYSKEEVDAMWAWGEY